MSLIKSIAETSADKDESKNAKRKFVVTVIGPDGDEIKKNCKAFNISDIKAYFGKQFVNAELYQDEKTADEDKDEDLASSDEMDPSSELEEDQDQKRDFDFKRMMVGAMSRDEYNQKYKLGKYSAKNKLVGPLIKKISEAKDAKGYEVLSEMAKRTTPVEFYKLCITKYGIKNASSMSWAMIKAVADGADILIPAYIRDSKIGQGVWDSRPKDMAAAMHEPAIIKDKGGPRIKREPKKEVDLAPVPEKKDAYDKADFPDVEFLWTTTYHEQKDMYNAIEMHHGVSRDDTESLRISKAVGSSRFGSLYQYYIVKKGTLNVLACWTMTGLDKVPGRGMVSYGNGNIALSKKAVKNRDDNTYGFSIKPQHGSAYVSVGTPNSHGPWDKFSAAAHVRDKYEHFEYDDDFGHGTISVVKVKKVNGKWELA